jgi:hypothetical protein
MNEAAELEAAVSELVETVLRERGLTNLGLTPVIRGIRRSGNAKTYQSEMTVDFFAENDFVDVVEFPVFRAGRAMASVEDFRAWFGSTLDDVLRRHSGRRSSN